MMDESLNKRTNELLDACQRFYSEAGAAAATIRSQGDYGPDALAGNLETCREAASLLATHIMALFMEDNQFQDDLSDLTNAKNPGPGRRPPLHI